MKSALRLPLAILSILLVGIGGAVLFRAGADDRPHSILLKWHPPAPGSGPAVTGYKVFRTQPDGTAVPVASVTAPTYLDTAVSPGMTYGYFVKSTDAKGHESPPSNYISVTVP